MFNNNNPQANNPQTGSVFTNTANNTAQTNSTPFGQTGTGNMFSGGLTNTNTQNKTNGTQGNLGANPQGGNATNMFSGLGNSKPLTGAPNNQNTTNSTNLFTTNTSTQPNNSMFTAGNNNPAPFGNQPTSTGNTTSMGFLGGATNNDNKQGGNTATGFNIPNTTTNNTPGQQASMFSGVQGKPNAPQNPAQTTGQTTNPTQFGGNNNTTAQPAENKANFSFPSTQTAQPLNTTGQQPQKPADSGTGGFGNFANKPTEQNKAPSSFSSNTNTQLFGGAGQKQDQPATTTPLAPTLGAPGLSGQGPANMFTNANNTATNPNDKKPTTGTSNMFNNTTNTDKPKDSQLGNTGTNPPVGMPNFNGNNTATNANKPAPPTNPGTGTGQANMFTANNNKATNPTQGQPPLGTQAPGTNTQPTDKNEVQKNDVKTPPVLNEALQDLFKRWKKDMDQQLLDLQDVGMGLRSNEEELVKKYQTINKMKAANHDTQFEFQNVDSKFEKISGDQDLVLEKLTFLEKELQNYVTVNNIQPGNYGRPINQQNILTKCQDMTRKVNIIEKEMDSMINKMGDSKVRNDNTYQSDTNTILNNFYESLRQLEIVTVNYQSQLDSFENNQNNN